jgi:hypothetical protein
VADLSRREASDYLYQLRVPTTLPSVGLADYVGRTLIVVARGTVTNGLDSRASPRADGLLLVVDADGVVRFVAIGPPWNTAVPPGAKPVPAGDQPGLNDVSQARARVELGGSSPIELPSPPSGLGLKRISINGERLPVDPSGTSFDGRSVTLIYADGSGRFRLWLTQSAAGDNPRVLGHPFLQAGADPRLTRYAWHAGSWEIDGFAWRYRGRSLFLTAEQGEDLTIETMLKTVYTLVDGPAS